MRSRFSLLSSALVGSALALLLVTSSARTAHAGYERTFDTGSIIIPMDLAYQDTGLLQAYGLVYQLLAHDITVYWVIDETKTWHAASCDTVGDECAWDCAEEGSGVKCDYPTASPDFFASAMVLWDSDGTLAPGTMIASHGYRGGPFVIDAADAEAARAIIDAWNDMSLWDANPWARRTIVHVVSAHETTAPLTANVKKEMIAAPTIAVFSDGNEDIATGYLRAAGIPQSNGAEFPSGRCRDGECGPGTVNPDMLTVVSIMGDMGTCDAPNTDHHNGALFDTDGSPAYCQIMSMHWGVNERRVVQRRRVSSDTGCMRGRDVHLSRPRGRRRGAQLPPDVHALLRRVPGGQRLREHGAEPELAVPRRRRAHRTLPHDRRHAARLSVRRGRR